MNVLTVKRGNKGRSKLIKDPMGQGVSITFQVFDLPVMVCSRLRRIMFQAFRQQVGRGGQDFGQLLQQRKEFGFLRREPTEKRIFHTYKF